MPRGSPERLTSPWPFLLTFAHIGITEMSTLPRRLSDDCEVAHATHVTPLFNDFSTVPQCEHAATCGGRVPYLDDRAEAIARAVRAVRASDVEMTIAGRRSCSPPGHVARGARGVIAALVRATALGSVVRSTCSRPL